HRQGKANPVIKKPSRLLPDADGAVDFVRTDAVLAVHNLPHSREPFVKTERRILHDGSGLQGEPRSVMLRAAVPAVVLLQKQNVLAAALRTDDAIRPATW